MDDNHENVTDVGRIGKKSEGVELGRNTDKKKQSLVKKTC